MSAGAEIQASRRASRILPVARRTVPLVPAWILLAILAASTIYPLIFIVFSALKTVSGFAADPIGPPVHPTLDSLQAVVTRGLLATNALNSFIISIAATAVIVAISCLAAFTLSFLKFPMRRVILLSIVGLMIQPTALLMIPLVLTVSNLGLISTYIGIVLVYAGLGVPFGTYLLYSYMQSTPRELFDAARVDGASTFRILYLVVMPLVAPALAALATLDFIGYWNEFLFALLILQNGDQKTIIVSLASLQGEQFLNVPIVASGMVVSILPPLVVFILLHRRLFSGLTAGSIQ